METQQEQVSTQTTLGFSSKQVTLAVAFAGVYILWGSTYFAIKILVHTVPVFLMAASRFLLGGAIMLAWALLTKQERPTSQQCIRAAISGIFLLVFGNGTMLFANRFIESSGVIAVVVAITPLWMVLLQWLWNKGAKPTLPIWTGIGLGILGMWYLANPNNLNALGHGSWIGLLIIIGGTISWAIGTIYSKSVVLPKSSIYTSAIQMLSASFWMLVLGTITGDWNELRLQDYGWDEGLSFLYLVLGGSVLGFTAYTYITQNAPASSVSTYAYVNPVIALFIGWWIGNEVISQRTLLACVLLLCGVVLIVLKPEIRPKSLQYKGH